MQMTTIAYRDGILAFDEQVTWGDARWASTAKAVKIGNMLVACSGTSGLCAAYINWLQENPDRLFSLAPVADWKQGTDSDFDALILREDGLFSFDGRGMPYRIEGTMIAAGSGMQFALGAMAMGASAEESVKIASAFDVKTGAVVKTLTLD